MAPLPPLRTDPRSGFRGRLVEDFTMWAPYRLKKMKVVTTPGEARQHLVTPVP
jgi:hypothetical protein